MSAQANRTGSGGDLPTLQPDTVLIVCPPLGDHPCVLWAFNVVATSPSARKRALSRPVRSGVLLVLLVVGASCAGSDTDTKVERIATGLENPRGIAVLPDGGLVVVEAGDGRETSDTTPR
ncbi:MAG: hypothetical protein ACC660_02060, partial [Acidimicrobiales bacterium]